MNKNYRIHEFAERIGRSTDTVRRWEREGKLIAKRLPSGHRYFDESDVRIILGKAPDKKDIVVYCRVSGAGQKDDLASQVAAMETYCLAAGIPVDQWIQEIGGGTDCSAIRAQSHAEFQAQTISDLVGSNTARRGQKGDGGAQRSFDAIWLRSVCAYCQ